MVKKKVGKQRKDKYYQLAKETGYRSRAAFKLIQLNRKFEFLQKSRVLLDLCAAPGGWMQVAKQNMPVSSIVVGVDLFPIKTIPGCIGIVGDITTDQCKQAISKELQTWKADAVLHDGAPNVGQNWLYDAYQQACLTLSAFKLATEFLKPGGWFITKVFRSKDYNPLLWVLKQFFKKVHATKPQASRNESAEMFVVCQSYIAPSKIDHRFLDPKYVFKELDMEPSPLNNLLKPENKKKKMKAEGYSEVHGVFKEVMITEFVKSDDPLEILQFASCLKFDNKDIENHESTTDEIKECCNDIRVLNRKDIKQLILWGKTMKAAFFEDSKKNIVKSDETVAEVETPIVKSEDEAELDEVDKKIAILEDQERKELKRKKKRSQKERSKLQEKLNLKMIHKGDDGPIEEDAVESMFSLNQIRTTQALEKVTQCVAPDDLAREESEDSDDSVDEYRSRSIRYEKGKGHLDSSGRFYKLEESEVEDSDASRLSFESDNEGLGFSDEEDKKEKKPAGKKVRFSQDTKTNDGEIGSDDDDDEEDAIGHPLITDLDKRNAATKRLYKAKLWFEKDIFNNLEEDADEEFELNQFASSIKKEGGVLVGQENEGGESSRSQQPNRVAKQSQSEEGYYSDGGSEDSGHDSDTKNDEESSESDTDSGDTDDDSDYDAEMEMAPVRKVSNNKGDFEIAPKESSKPRKRKLDAEGLAMGAMMISSRKKKRDLIDAGWNRYTFNDPNLPDWFVEDEKIYMRKEAPVPKEMIDEYESKKEEINARPIKKVLEAKARKKKRMMKKLERARKRMEGLMENPDMSEKEKARQIARLYKSAKGKKPEVTYVVSKKHTASKRVSRPKGVKGHYKVVDPRMKKDTRAEKRKLSKKGRKQKFPKKRGARKSAAAAV